MRPLGHLAKFAAKARRCLSPSYQSSIGQIVRSIPEVLWQPSLARHVIAMDSIRPASVERYRIEGAAVPLFRTEMHFARRYVYRLQHVRVHPITGACEAGCHLIQESYGSLRRCLLDEPFPRRGYPRRPQNSRATVVHSTGYGHFILEELPRLLWVLERYPDTQVFLADSAPRFCREALDLLRARGILSRYSVCDPGEILLMAEYVFTQAEAYSGFFHSADIRQIRAKCLPPAPSRRKSTEKLYITRRHASRTFDNERELETALTALGFRVVSLETMSLNDEIELLSRTSVIVGSHGAGLANLVWCQPNARVVELFSPKLTNDCYARLSSTLGLRYTPVYATQADGWGLLDVQHVLQVVSEPCEPESLPPANRAKLASQSE